jgi:hypothetical protein
MRLAMTDVLDRDEVRAFLEVGPGLRGRLERALDALLDLLDGLDDPDLEEGADLEPDADDEVSLGSPSESKSQVRWAKARRQTDGMPIGNSTTAIWSPASAASSVIRTPTAR